MFRVLIFRYKMVVLFNWDLRNISMKNLFIHESNHLLRISSVYTCLGGVYIVSVVSLDHTGTWKRSWKLISRAESRFPQLTDGCAGCWCFPCCSWSCCHDPSATAVAAAAAEAGDGRRVELWFPRKLWCLLWRHTRVMWWLDGRLGVLREYGDTATTE